METGLSEHDRASCAAGRLFALPKDIRLLSLDVFDTALRRCFSQPDHIFCLTQRKLAQQGLAIRDFADLRRKAEGLARHTALHAHRREETTLDEIYQHLGTLTGLPDALLLAAKSAEIASEMESVQADPAILDLYRQARLAGIPVVFLSDMYLPEPVISRMLAAQGFDAHLAVFVSSAHGRAKAQGGLFTAVLELFALAPERMLHIGDNSHADGSVPAGLGIRTRLYRHARHTLHKARPLHPAVLPLSRLKAAHWSPAVADSPDARLAFLGKTHGPLIHGAFTRWIAENARARQAELLLFFSRDGFILKKIYDLFRAKDHALPPSAYCCVSRFTLRTARMVHFDDADYDFLLSGLQAKSAGQLLRRSGIPLLPRTEASVLAACGLAPGDLVPVFGKEKQQAREALRALEIPLRAMAAQQRVSLDGYLRRFALNRYKRILIVDLGWAGNLQRCFEEALVRQGFGGEILGLYLGLFREAWAHRARGSRMKAFLPEYGTDALAPVLQDMIPLIELLHSAPHGGVTGYEQRRGAFQPRFADNPLERRQYDQSIAVYHKAVLAAVAKRTPWDEDFTAQACKDALCDLCAHPSPQEAEVLGGLVHFDGFEHNSGGVAIAPKMPPETSPDSLRQALNAAYWKAGFLARNSLPASPAFPANPASPTFPAYSAATATPAFTTSPADPAPPAFPDSPACPADPACPASTADPVSPAFPAGPTFPAYLASTACPTDPACPADPALSLPQAGEAEETAPLAAARAPRTILFVVHVMDRSGAPLLLLHYLRWLKLHTDISLRVLALGAGELAPLFEALAPVLLYQGTTLPGARDAEDELRQVRKFCGPGLGLVYLNSAFSAAIHATVARLGVAVLAHVHELEHVLRTYIPGDVMAFLTTHAACRIATSPLGKRNLVDRHGFPPSRITEVAYHTQPTTALCPPQRKAALRRALGMPEDAVVVVGCGALEWRKGPDLFADVARRVRDAGAGPAVFYWIGRQLPGGLNLDEYLADNGLEGIVRCVGAKDNYKEYFQAGDIFLMTSREEIFSLATLEACECTMAAVSFADAGIAEFLTSDIGRIIPPGDTAAMAAAVVALVNAPEERRKMGRAARARMLETCTTDSIAPFLLDICLTAGGMHIRR